VRITTLPTVKGEGAALRILERSVRAPSLTDIGFSDDLQLALEFRGNDGGIRFRLAGEYTSFGKIGELSFKYDYFEGFFFRPFLGVGVGVASINPDAAIRAAGSASAGIDLYLGRDFFLTGEVKQRLFMEGTDGSAHGLVTSERKQTSFLAGMGFYFF